MIWLGVDPGLAQTGYGVVASEGNRLRAVDFGLFRTSPRKPLTERVSSIYRHFRDLLTIHRPQALIMERLYALRSGGTGLAIGQAMGVILLAAHEAGLEVVEYTPTHVKQAVVGYGRATKEQVQYMVQQLLNLPEAPNDHAADALALCICHAHTVAGRPELQSERPSGSALPSSLAERIAAALEADAVQRAVHRRRRGKSTD